MKLLAEITEASLQIGDEEQLGEYYELRKSARAIVLNESGEMAVQYLSNHGYHKLPGGGLDPGEEIEATLVREIREEVGCACLPVCQLGVVIEYRNQHHLLHISYGYVVQVRGTLQTPQLEQAEVDEGQETKWLLPDIVATQIDQDVPDQYKAHFILARERAFLREYMISAETGSSS